MKRLHKHRNWLGAGVLVLILAVLLGGIYIKNRVSPQPIGYVQFMEALEQSRITEVTLSDSAQFTFRYVNDDTLYITDNPRKADFKEELLLKGLTVKEGGTNVGDQWLQLGFSVALIAGVFYMIQRGGNRSAIKSTFSVNKVSDTSDVKKYSFNDIAGQTEAKESVADVVDFLTNPQKYARYGARMPRGIILHGQPGTGKTLMARAVAGEAGVPFYAVNGSDFVQMYVGVGAARVRELFKKARESGKAVIFIDEIDALGKKRGDVNGGSNDEREQTLNALLTEMSGFSVDDGIVVMAATNRPDTLDDALMRPGRFDRQIEIGLPDINARKDILTLHARNKPLSVAVDLDKWATDTVFFSGAMLEGLLNEAAIIAAKRGVEQIAPEDIEQAYYITVAGHEKKDRSAIREQERRVTAYHESGHALAAKLVTPDGIVSKVTVIPSTRGAGGFCLNIPPERMYYTKKELEHQIMVYIAGRCAEELIFGSDQVTTGASNDIEKATKAAEQYIARYGMGERTGLMNLTGSRNTRLLTRECKRLLDKLYNETLRLLEENSRTLTALAEALLSRETLHEEDITRILAENRV